MRDEYDFSQGRRGAVATDANQKSRITAYLDKDVLEALKAQAQAESEASGAKIGYQTILNRTLRQALELDKAAETREQTVGEMGVKELRRVIREELGQKGEAQTRPWTHFRLAQSQHTVGKAVYRFSGKKVTIL